MDQSAPLWIVVLSVLAGLLLLALVCLLLWKVTCSVLQLFCDGGQPIGRSITQSNRVIGSVRHQR